jgi:hypothetical protein
MKGVQKKVENAIRRTAHFLLSIGSIDRVDIEQERVLKFLKQKGTATPLEVGLHLGVGYYSASSYGSSILKELMVLHRVVKVETGKYQAI